MDEGRPAETCDILVIGAGPAGSSAARAAAQSGARVLLIDKRQQIGVPVQCAEFVHGTISRYASFSSKCVIQEIETMVTHLPDGTTYEMQSPGYMLNRSLFDKELAVSAVLSGAQVLTGTRALGYLPEGVIIEKEKKNRTIRAKVVVGADGVHSIVSRWMGFSPLRRIVALQYEVIHSQPQKETDVFFRRDYEGGYGWFFPKGNTANVGIGVVPQKVSLLPDLLEDLLGRLVVLRKMRSIEIIGKTGGSVPCDLSPSSVLGNLMLVGDAAGQAHPITGAGILNAVIGGEIAGRVAAEAVARDDLDYLKNYEVEWRDFFGQPLSYGASKRMYLEENWNKNGTGFEDLIRKTWVGFKEYYQDRRKIPLHPPFSKGEVTPL
jgi:geranylgeranyl reductase family protein